MVYRRTEAEMTCTQAELDIARLDGCNTLWLAAPVAIAGENGKVKALVCEVMKLGAPDQSGKPAPVRTGETVTLEVDMVIKATGQSPYLDLVEDNDLENSRGKISDQRKRANQYQRCICRWRLRERRKRSGGCGAGRERRRSF